MKRGVKLFGVLLVFAMIFAFAIPALAESAQDPDFSVETQEALAEAIADAEEGDVIALLADIELTEGLHIEAGKKLTLDLNGKVLSQEKVQTAGYQMILNDGDLTIDDTVGGGKLSYKDLGNGGEYISDVIYNRATLVINGGTIENLSSEAVADAGYPHAVDTYSGIRDTKVTVNGGVIYCENYSAVRMFCVSAAYKADLVINGGTIRGAVDMQNGSKPAALGTLTVNGGTFETTANVNNIRFANWNGGATEYGLTASIKGGSFEGGITTAYVPAAAEFNKKFITGGTFEKDISEYLAEDYEAVETEDGFVVSEIKAAAIGSKTYPSLQKAIDAAGAGDVVKLLEDIDLGGATVTVAADKKIVLDLNGFNITGTPDELKAYAVIQNLGDLTLQGEGTILCDHKLAGSTAYAVNTIVNHGKLTVNGGAIKNVSTAAAQIGYAIDNNSTSYDSVVIINGGEIAAEGSLYYDGIRQFCNSMTAVNSVTVNGGTVSSIWMQNPSDGSEKNTKDVEGDLTITGGTVGAVYVEPSLNFEASVTGGIFGSFVYNQPIEGRNLEGILAGGIFEEEPASELIAEGYKVTETEDGFVVSEIKAAAIGSETYPSLQKAIDAAGAGDVVKLLEDIDLGGATVTVAADKKIVLDLNGFDIIGTPDELKAYAVIQNLGDLTLRGEGTILCDHKLAGSTAYAVNTIVNHGKLTVNGGAIKNVSTAAAQIGYAIDNNSTSYDSVVIINGGEVAAEGSLYYDGIRQFCNSMTAVNSVTVNGGSVSSIWMQNPSDGSEKNTKDVEGDLTITGGTVGAVYVEPSLNFEASVTGGVFGSFVYNQPIEGRNLEGILAGGIFEEEPASELIAERCYVVETEEGFAVVNVSEMKNGWLLLGDNWVYVENGDLARAKWMKDSKGWCYLGADGLMVTNDWVADSKGLCYIGSAGYILTNQWFDTENGPVFLDGDGRKTVNKWVKDGTKWCYMNAEGYRTVSQWCEDSKGWCYIDENGYMMTSSIVADGKGLCYLGADGYQVMKEGWQKTQEGKWVYVRSGGYLAKSQWRKDSKGWCYLGADGCMVTKDVVPDSKGLCFVGADGYQVTKVSWQLTQEGKWVYIKSGGYLAVNEWMKDSKGWCKLGKDGYMITNAWTTDSKGPCYIGEDGYCLTGEQIIGGVTYVFNDNGQLIEGIVPDGTEFV